MKEFLKKNKVTLLVIAFSLLCFGALSVFSKPFVTPQKEEEKKYVIPIKDAKLLDLKVTASSGIPEKSNLAYSLSFPSTLIRETKYGGQTTHFYYDGRRVASLTFVPNTKPPLSAFDYAKGTLGSKVPLAIGTAQTFFKKQGYITAGASEAYFRIGLFKGGSWIGYFEVLEGNEALESIILNSLVVK